MVKTLQEQLGSGVDTKDFIAAASQYGSPEMKSQLTILLEAEDPRKHPSSSH